MKEKFLPIGTVVILKGASKKIMVTGFMPLDSKNNEQYDYLACPFPEGYISSNEYLLFNHSQIDKIFYMGFENEESTDFNNVIHKFLEQENKTTISNNVENSNAVLEQTVTNPNVINAQNAVVTPGGSVATQTEQSQNTVVQNATSNTPVQNASSHSITQQELKSDLTPDFEPIETEN